jgi:hypothetical protein
MFAFPDLCDDKLLPSCFKSLEDLYLEANHCVILMSEAYLEQRWRIQERRMAMEKARAKRGDGYFTTLWVDKGPTPNIGNILPIRSLIGQRSVIDPTISRISKGLGLWPEIRVPELE